MKVVILAGGFGTRISEESHLKPKPMIEIGEKPILWHIMKEYSAYGTNFPLLGIGFAIPLLWFIVFLLSWGGTFIMLKIPGLKDLL